MESIGRFLPNPLMTLRTGRSLMYFLSTHRLDAVKCKKPISYKDAFKNILYIPVNIPRMCLISRPSWPGVWVRRLMCSILIFVLWRIKWINWLNKILNFALFFFFFLLKKLWDFLTKVKEKCLSFGTLFKTSINLIPV